MAEVTVNCDMGESFGLYTFVADERLMPLIDMANVACGFHASDFNHMRRTVQLAKKYGVAVGAHPSLPDLQGFGRREMAISREELANCIIYQIGALSGFLAAEGVQLSHIKPHGSLYGMTAREAELAHAVVATSHLPSARSASIPTHRIRLRSPEPSTGLWGRTTMQNTHQETRHDTKTGTRASDVRLA
jgi:lactam utilization protein B